MKNFIFTFYEDDGHGWYAVSASECRALGIKVTGYSYCKGNILYLEEDCDGSVFFEAYKRKYGKYPDITKVRQDGESPIRYYSDNIPADLLNNNFYKKFLYGRR